LTATRPVSGYAVDEHLSAHAEWRGPVKLMRDREATFERMDVYLSKSDWAQSDPALDEDAAADHEELLADLAEAAGAILAGAVDVQTWRAPPAEAIVDWLVADGRRPRWTRRATSA
jgi:hypothetical protein